jgi:hypothetical protein
MRVVQRGEEFLAEPDTSDEQQVLAVAATSHQRLYVTVQASLSASELQQADQTRPTNASEQ